MKKWYLVLVLVLIFSCKGKEGPMGPSGSDGKDAVSNKVTYNFFPVGNPYAKLIPEINLTKLEAGSQIVQAYMSLLGYWAELPVTAEVAGIEYDHFIFIKNGAVQLESYAGGVFTTDAANGYQCMVVVTDLN